MFREVKSGDKIKILPNNRWVQSWIGVIEYKGGGKIKMLNPYYKEYNNIGSTVVVSNEAFSEKNYNWTWLFLEKKVKSPNWL